MEIRSLQYFLYPLVPPQSQVFPKELQHASSDSSLSNVYIAQNLMQMNNSSEIS